MRSPLFARFSRRSPRLIASAMVSGWLDETADAGVVSSVSSGWKAAARMTPSRTSTGWSSTVASTSTSSHGLDPRRPDEHGVERILEPLDLQVGLEGVHLAPEGVAANLDRSSTPRDRWSSRPSRTSVASMMRPAQVPKTGIPSSRRAVSGFPQVVAVELHRHRGGLAAGYDERIDLGQLVGGADLTSLDPQTGQDLYVAGEGSLEGEDADPGRLGHQPRSARVVSSWSISRPGMASPRPVLTLARMWASA